MLDSFFTEEHKLFREGFRSFLAQEVVPHLDEWEKTGTIPRDIWPKFGEMGYFGILYPEIWWTRLRYILPGCLAGRNATD